MSMETLVQNEFAKVEAFIKRQPLSHKARSRADIIREVDSFKMFVIGLLGSIKADTMSNIEDAVAEKMTEEIKARKNVETELTATQNKLNAEKSKVEDLTKNVASKNDKISELEDKIKELSDTSKKKK